MDAASRLYLREEGIKYSASCNPARFGAEKSLLHESETDVVGQHATIFNDVTKELFTYHFDSQKGVGKKFNMSWGLERNTQKRRVLEMKNHILGYEYYKNMFETCDKFNRKYRDRKRPFRRGGGEALGENGRAHDFIFSSILQNCRNLHSDVNDYDQLETSFKDQCLVLTDQLYEYSLTL